MHTGVLVGKPERKRPSGRPRRKGITINKIFKKQNGDMECIDPALDRDTGCALMQEVMNLQVPHVVTDYLSNY